MNTKLPSSIARLHPRAGEQGGESGEGQRAINHLHRHRPEADQQRPDQPAPRPFVHDGQVDRPDRDGEQKPAEKTGQRRDERGRKIEEHVKG